MPSVSTVSPLRLLAVGPLAAAVLALPLGLVTAPALLASTTSTAVQPVVAAESPTPTPTRQPTRQPTTAPPIIPPPPSETTEPTETAGPTETAEPTATSTRTRTRTSSPRPRRTTQAPVVRETPDEAIPAVTGGGLGIGSASPGLLDLTPEVTAEPTTAAVAVSTGAPADTVTRLIQLVVSAGVLLGIGGGVGLYLTRT